MLFVVFTFPHLMYLSLRIYPEHVMERVNLFVILFMLVYLVLRFLYFYKMQPVSKLKDFSDLKNEPEGLMNFIFLIEIVSMAVVLFYMHRRGGTILTAVAYGDYEVGIVEQIAMVTFISLSGIGFVYLMRKEYVKFIVIAVCYAMYLIITQIRYNMVGFVAPFLIFFIFSTDRKRIALGVGMGFMVIFFVYLFQQLRWLGGIGNLSKVGFETVVDRAMGYFRQGNGEIGLVRAFYYFVRHNNHFPNFGQGNGFVRLALILFPASVFAFKPRDFAIDMYKEWFGKDDPMGTMHPTLFGDAFGNFGYAGWITGIFYAGLFMLLDEMINHEDCKTVSVLKASLCCTMAILIGRGAIYNAIINFLFGLAVIYMVKKIYFYWCGRKKRHGSFA